MINIVWQLLLAVEIIVDGELEDNTAKDAEMPKKVTLTPRPPPPFPQRLLKKTEDGKYRRFITMLKQLSINVPLVEALDKCPVMPSS